MVLSNIVITAYCACKLCCGTKAANICADGKHPTQGITVAASRKYPLGSKLIYNGHTYIIEDRLAKRFDSRVDIFFTNHADALKFGIKKNQTIEILEK